MVQSLLELLEDLMVQSLLVLQPLLELLEVLMVQSLLVLLLVQ